VKRAAFSRGLFLKGAAVSALSTLSTSRVFAAIPSGNVDRVESLGQIAQRNGRYFGSAASIDQINSQPALKRAMIADCTHLTPEIHLKWNSIEWQRNEFNFSPVDDLLSFADENGMTVRGHTLIWEQSTPQWASREMIASKDWRIVSRYFARVLGRYGSRIDEWDVVNEAIDTEAGQDNLRLTSFYKAFGPEYISRALHEAHACAPNARLVINDYGFEYGNDTEVSRRAAFLTLLRKLRKAGAPLNGVGLQAHLDLSKGCLDAAAISDFMKSIHEMGLEIAITELDVKEKDLTPPLEVRDTRVADHAFRYLDIAFKAVPVRGVITWGLSDRYSWLSSSARVGSSMPSIDMPYVNRGVPYDSSLIRKSLYGGIADALKAPPVS
jgi:endo-1,4-beta-xylanase